MGFWRRASDDEEDPLKEKANASSKTFLRLTRFEDRLLMSGGRLVSTLTWFRGRHESAAQHFQQRLELMVQANPWLTGQIVRRRGANYLAYDNSDPETLKAATDALFFHIPPPESPLSRHIPLDELSGICRQHDLTLQPRYYQPLYRVSVVPCRKSPDTQFALIVSLSHLAGDGYTFYQLYQTLLANSTVETTGTAVPEESVEVPEEPKPSIDTSVPVLKAERVPQYADDLEELLQSRREPLLALSYSFVLPSVGALIAGKIRSLCCANYRLQHHYFLVDRDTIEQMKQEASSNDAEELQLSLNDVVTSWYMTHSRCRHGFMAMNLRGRRAGYTENLAGNYLASMYYQIPKHCATPQLIRRSLAQFKRVDDTAKAVRPPAQLLLGGGAIITNWAGIANADVNLVLLDGSRLEEEIHLPLYTHQADTQPANVVFAFLFRAGPNQLGMFTCGSPSKVNGLRDCPFARPMA